MVTLTVLTTFDMESLPKNHLNYANALCNCSLFVLLYMFMGKGQFHWIISRFTRSFLF